MRPGCYIIYTRILRGGYVTMKKKYTMNYTFRDDSNNGYVISSSENGRQPYDFYAYLGLAALLTPAASLFPALLAYLFFGEKFYKYVYIAVFAFLIICMICGIIGIIRRKAYGKRCLLSAIIGGLYPIAFKYLIDLMIMGGA